MDGIELMEAIKKLDKPGLPTFVMTSGLGLEMDIGILRDMGVFEVIVKPVNSSELHDVIERALEHRRSKARV